MRKAGLARVRPSILADFILVDACYNRKSRSSTQYIEQIYEKLSGQAKRNAFANISRIDWQIFDQSHDSSLTDLFWSQIKNEMDRALTPGQHQSVMQGTVHDLLDLVQGVAHYQVNQTLELVTVIIGKKSLLFTDSETDWVAYLIYRLATTLAGVIHYIDNPARYRRTLDLLWELGMMDNGRYTTNRDSRHPASVLIDSAYLGDNKSENSQVAVEACQSWLDSFNDFSQQPYSPFDILEKMLSTDDIKGFSIGNKVGVETTGLCPTADIKKTRSRIIKLLLDQIVSTDVQRAIQATKTLSRGWSYPSNYNNPSITEEVVKAWRSVFEEEMKQLQTVVQSRADLHPLVLIEISRILQRREPKDTPIRRIARAILDDMASRDGYELAVFLCGNSGLVVQEDREQITHDLLVKKYNTYLDDFTDKFLKQSDMNTRIRQLEYMLDKLQDAKIDREPITSHGLSSLFRAKIDFAQKVCQYVIKDSGSPLIIALQPALIQLRLKKPKEFLQLSNQLLGTSNEVDAAVAWSLGELYRVGEASLEEEIDLLLRCAKSSSPKARLAVLLVANHICRQYPAEAIRLVEAVDITTDELREEFFSNFGSYGNMEWANLSSSYREVIWQKLSTGKLDGYKAEDFLANIFQRRTLKGGGVAFAENRGRCFG